MGFVLAWLVSKEGVALVGAGLAALWTYATRKSKRKRSLDELADELFGVVEELGIRDRLKGDEKWKRFAAMLIDHAKAEGLGKPSGAEMWRYQLRAIRSAWLAKQARRAPSP